METNNMLVELAALREKLRASKAEKKSLTVELYALRENVRQQESVAQAISQSSRQEKLKDSEDKSLLSARVSELEAACDERDARLVALQERYENANVKLAETAELSSSVTSLEQVVSRQQNEIAEMKDRLEKGEAEFHELKKNFVAKAEENERLILKSGGRTDLTVIFGEPWLLRRKRHKLEGDLPLVSISNTLTCVGKFLVMHNGEGGETATSPLKMLNISTFTWEKKFEGEKVDAGEQLSGHISAPLSNSKLVSTGGRRYDGSVTNELRVFNVDNMRWTSPACKGSFPSREYHASCVLQDKMYVWGGSDEHRNLLVTDMFFLDLETMTWETRSAHGKLTPNPRYGHSLCGSGTKMYLCGGHDGRTFLNDIWCYETDKQVWSCLPTNGTIPSPRKGHAAQMIGRFLFIAGGDDGKRQFAEVFALDTDSLIWECIIDWRETGLRGDLADSDGATVHGLKPGSRYFQFQKNRLYLLKPSGPNEFVGEVEMMEFTLPESIQALRSVQVSDSGTSCLELLSDAATAHDSIQLSWRASSVNSDRVLQFKLMMASSTGVVKEVVTCSGKQKGFKVTGLRSKTEYVFCVKATYLDGTHEWSESRAFKTR